MRLVFISDTHNKHHKMTHPIPDGDVLIHCGDISHRGKFKAIKAFNKWLGDLPHPHKIMIAGNHDFYFQNEPVHAPKAITNATYLLDSATTIDGVKFYGSPWSPWFHNWAFNLHRGEPIREKWQLIPEDTDVLITHGPPFGQRDFVPLAQKHVGCEELMARVLEIKPRVHAFGHIHEGYGRAQNEHTWFVNASVCDIGRLAPVNAPIVVDL